MNYNFWCVSLNGKHIDKVSYDKSYTNAEEVKCSLIRHDGYDPAIVVRKERKKKQ